MAQPARKHSKPASLSARAKVVWVSLLFAMTGVGGLLLALDDRPAPNTGGVTLTPLVATGTTSSIDQIFLTDNPLDKPRWTSIVIHHSGSLAGGPVSIAAQHTAQKLKGLGHHFVVGNGRGGEMTDGELHLGFRWMQQLPGAHAAGPRGPEFNQHAISICLVGDGNRQSFTPLQLARLNQLVDALRERFNIPADRVLLHSNIATGVKDPGKLFPEAALRERLSASR